MTPIKPLIFSILFTGNTLHISKNLNKIKASRKALKLNGINAIAIHCPKTSSMTTSWGSILLEYFRYSSTAKKLINVKIKKHDIKILWPNILIIEAPAKSPPNEPIVPGKYFTLP